MSCYNYCGYSPCCYYKPCCYFCYNVVLGTPSSTNITNTPLASTLVFTLSNPSNGWTGSGSYTVATNGTSTTGSASFVYNGSCCTPSFTIPVSASYNGTTTTGTLTVTISCNCVRLSGSVSVGGGTVNFTGNGCLYGCGTNKNVTLRNITITGSV